MRRDSEEHGSEKACDCLRSYEEILVRDRSIAVNDAEGSKAYALQKKG